MKLIDIISIVSTAALIVFFSITVYTIDTGIPYVKITTAGGTFLYPLDGDRGLSVSGPLGETRIAIQGGTTVVADSPCPHKICMNTKPLSFNGEWTACLPNQVFINIQGAKEHHIDAISY